MYVWTLFKSSSVEKHPNKYCDFLIQLIFLQLLKKYKLLPNDSELLTVLWSKIGLKYDGRIIIKVI